MPVKPTLALCLLGACITETTHPTTTVTARWTLQDLVTGLDTGCPAGFDVAELVATPDAGGDAITTDFPCVDGTGVSAPLAAVPYTFTIAIRADAGTLYAQSLPQSLDLTDGDSQWLAATILNDGGYAHVTWTLVGAVSGATLSCADAIVDTIVVTATSGHGSYTDQLPCEDEVGQTRALPIGTYDFAIAASRQGEAIGTTALAAQIIHNRNGVTDLGSVQIAVVGL